jgi:hypothetical protein
MVVCHSGALPEANIATRLRNRFVLGAQLRAIFFARPLVHLDEICAPEGMHHQLIPPRRRPLCGLVFRQGEIPDIFARRFDDRQISYIFSVKSLIF